VRRRPSTVFIQLARDRHAVWVADAGGRHLVGYLWVRLLRDHQGYVPRLRGYINHA
jgi:hypothetical protein